MILQLDMISKRFPRQETAALCEIRFQVRRGEILRLAGESGSGKTTLLRLIAGLEYPDEGRIELGGKVVTDLGELPRPEGLNGAQQAWLSIRPHDLRLQANGSGVPATVPDVRFQGHCLELAVKSVAVCRATGPAGCRPRR